MLPTVHDSKAFLDAQNDKIERNNLVSSSFVRYLIKKGTLKKNSNQFNPEEGDIGIYSNDNKIQHAGIIIKDINNQLKIESKLGILPVYLHNFYQMPCNYGSNIEYYNLLCSSNELTKILKDFYS